MGHLKGWCRRVMAKVMAMMNVMEGMDDVMV
jgi:hypothetical protein